MAKYITRNQLIGDIGEMLVGYILSSKLNIIFRPLSKRDTGVDGEIEITQEFDETKLIATGVFIKVQVKSSVDKIFKNGKLSIQLSTEDKDYFSSDLNLPGILLFADLKNAKHEVYWAEIIPTKFRKNSVVVIKEENIINERSIEIFKRIESYYKSRRLREELISLIDQSYNMLSEYIVGSSKEDGLGIFISDFDEEIQSIRDVHTLSIVKNVKKKDIPEYENIMDSDFEVQKKIKEGKQLINEILSKKGFDSYDYYLNC